MVTDRNTPVERLTARIAELEAALNRPGSTEMSIAGLPSFLLRINDRGLIRYYNTGFAEYLQVARDTLIGQPQSILARYFETDVVTAIETSGSAGRTVPDDRRGKILQICSTYRGGWLDVVIDDVTNAERLMAYARRYMPPGLTEGLTEDEHATFRFPERRYMTVSFVDLRGFTSLAEQLSPEEVRDTVNAYIEEAIDAINRNEATLDKIVGDEVMALFGAPRYYADHALRAIKTAFDTMSALKALQTQFVAMGKQMPSCGIGINTGEMVLGNIGNAQHQNYTVVGSSVNLASRLCSVAHGGEVLVTEETLRAVIESLPEDWQVVRAVSETEVDLNAIRGKIDGVMELDSETRGLVYAVGPGVEQSMSHAQFYFYYLYQVRPRGANDAIRVISVVPGSETNRIQLSGDTVTVSKTEKIFGRFRLIEIIGRGGMGEVWKARDNFGNNVAIKMLRAGDGASDNQLRRFKREAEVMARLSHRNICRIFEVGEAEGVSFIAMEFVDGATLAEILGHKKILGEQAGGLAADDVVSVIKAIQQHRIDPQPRPEGSEPVYIDSAADGYLVLPVQQIIAILIKVCEAVQAAHEIGVLHRDLKPGNIIIRPDGDPVVMDFGLAKMGDSETDELEASLSMSGQIVGTIEYMAPEQAVSSKDVDERADVYSLGAILYQMITGAKHFQSSGNILGDAQRLQSFEAIPPRQVKKGVDPDLEIITQKALRNQRWDRYRSSSALRDDLERYRRGEVISAKGVSIGEVASKWFKRNRAVASVSMAAVALLVISAVYFLIQLSTSNAVAQSKRIEAEEALLKAEEQRALAETATLRAEEQVKLVEAQKIELKREGDRASAALAAKEKAEKQASQARTSSAPYFYLAQALQAIDNGQLDQALEAVNKSLNANPRFVDSWMLRTRVQLGRFDLADAKIAFDAVKTCPGFVAKPDYASLEDLINRYAKVCGMLPNAKQDWELQAALARVLYNRAEKDEKRMGELLNNSAMMLKSGTPATP